MMPKICDTCLRYFMGYDENRTLLDLDNITCKHYKLPFMERYAKR